MSPKLEEMSAFFNTRAEIYNEKHVEGIAGGIESKQIIASFLPEHTKTIIDFGIGTGLELEEIFKRFPNVEVTGLDIAENMLKLLKETYPDKNIRARYASYLDYDFGKSGYDVALSVMTLHHYEHETKTDLYRKIYDCLKPNSIYIECDYILSEEEFENAQELEDLYFSEYKRYMDEQGLNENEEYHYDRPCTVSNQKKMLSDAGFKNIREVWRRGSTVILIADK